MAGLELDPLALWDLRELLFIDVFVAKHLFAPVCLIYCCISYLYLSLLSFSISVFEDVTGLYINPGMTIDLSSSSKTLLIVQVCPCFMIINLNDLIVLLRIQMKDVIHVFAIFPDLDFSLHIQVFGHCISFQLIQ